MTLIEIEPEKREFIVGTTGWTADDLDDPDFEAFWDQGRYEIVEGVLTQMPAARLDDGASFMKFLARLQVYLDDSKVGGLLSIETDLVLKRMRVPRGDAVYIDPEGLRRQEEINSKSRRPRGRYGRAKVAPTLVIESVSIGHEAHDRETKRQWYAEAGVPHYWLFDAYTKTVETLVLDGADYRTEALFHEKDEFRTSLFAGLVIGLNKIWV